MFQPLLKEKFEYFTNYFETALQNKKRSFAQSIVLYGQDSIAQYYIALDIARQLNCQKDTASNCDCLNCNWIKNNQHPAILTISKNDNKPSDDTSSKVISIKQTLMINNSLINSSEYYRVFIFCDSQIVNISEQDKINLNKYQSLGFKFPQEDWLPKPLTREVLVAASANSLLKSIEEPPERTLFIFLTKDKEDIIETIISRSQSFYIPALNTMTYDTSFLSDILNDYPQINKIKVLDIVAKLMNIADEKGLETSYILDTMEFYFAQMIKNNLNNKPLIQKIKKDITHIQLAKKQAETYIRPQLIFENLFFSFL